MDPAVDALRVPESPRPGDEVGVYRLLEELGAGGMGRVFLAEHVKLGRRVAIKVLQPELWHNRRSVQRFFQEARLVNRIDHENIVQIHDYVQEPDGLSYFIMELLVGRDLTQSRERNGPFSLARTLRILRQMASALAAAHAQGVVHRDLKPGNIFLVQKPGRIDFVKLLDFGIAKLQDDADMEAPRTRTGTIVGTPLYMSPEQASGERVDARSDLYSLGVVAFWMLSDAFPFKAKSFAELIAKQASQPALALPTVTASGEAIPEALGRVIERCLKRNPRDRFQDAGEFDSAIEDVCSELPAMDPIPLPMTPPPSHDAPRKAAKRRGLRPVLAKLRTRPRWPGLLAGALVFSVGGTIVLAARYRQRHLSDSPRVEVLHSSEAALPSTPGAPSQAEAPQAQQSPTPAAGSAASAATLRAPPDAAARQPAFAIPPTSIAAPAHAIHHPARPSHARPERVRATPAAGPTRVPHPSDDDDVLDPFRKRGSSSPP